MIIKCKGWNLIINGNVCVVKSILNKTKYTFDIKQMKQKGNYINFQDDKIFLGVKILESEEDI